MTPHYSDDQVTLYHGDCLEVLRSDDYGYDWNLGYREARLFADNSVDAIVTDPPYGLEFMGKDWDAPWRTGNGFRRSQNQSDTGRDNVFGRQSKRGPEYFAGTEFQQWCTAWASECLRVLKPGGHLLAFGGSRTWHRLAAAIEDAGFEIRDSIAWLYGSGFPKSLDVSKAIDKAAGAEREPDEYTGPNNLNAVYGKGMGGGVTTRRGAPATDAARQWQGWGTALKPAFEPIVVARKPLAGTVAANVLEYGTGALNIDACRVGDGSESQGQRSPQESSSSRRYADTGAVNIAATPGPRGGSESGRWPTNVVLDDTQAAELDAQTGITRSHGGGLGTGSRKPAQGVPLVGGIATTEHLDVGGASRFFPVFRYEAKAPGAERPSANGVVHPTVKPLDLMRWLVRLVTPPNGVVLDPFAGSGTTAEACIHEHKRCITIEREADYLPLIVNRLSKPIEIGFDFEEPA